MRYILALLSLSILLNVWLATRTANDNERVQQPPPVQNLSDRSSDQQGEQPSQRSISAQTVSKEHVLSDLLKIHVQSIPPPNDNYWEVDPAKSSLEYKIRELEGYQQVRNALVQQYGSNAHLDPAFASVFFPLSTSEPYLSSTEQIEMQRNQAELALQRYSERPTMSLLSQFKSSQQNSMAMDRGRSAFLPADRSAMPPRENPADAGENPLLSILTESSKKEFDRRHSRTASVLRESNYAFSKNTFDDAFDTLQTMMAARQNRNFSHNRAESLRTLSTTLDIETTVNIWKELDLEFAMLHEQSTDAGLNADEMIQAYEIFQDANSSFYEAEQMREVNPEDSSYLVKQAVENRKERLAKLFGEDVAREMTRIRR